MKAKIYKDINEELIKEWTELWEKSAHAHFFNSYAWFAVCKEIFKPEKLLITCVYKDDELQVIYPLFEQKKYGIKTYGNPGGRFADKSCILIKEQDAKTVILLLRSIQSKYNLIVEEVSEENYLYFRSSGYIESPVKEEASSFQLEEDNLRFMGKKKRKKLLSKYKKNFEQTEHRRFKGSELIEYFKYIELIDANSRKRLSGKEVTSDGIQWRLFKRIAKDFPQYLVLDVLFIEGEPIVYELGIIAKNREIGYQTAFDERKKKYEPGRVILIYIWESMREEELETYDWARGVNGLKKDFTPKFERQYSFYSANILALSLWYSLDFCRELILNNDFLYRIYLFFKNTLLTQQEK